MRNRWLAPPWAICLNKGTTEPLELKHYETGSNEFCLHILFRSFNCRIAHISRLSFYSLPSRYLDWLPYPWKPWQTSPHYVRKPNRPGFCSFNIGQNTAGFLPSTAHACMLMHNVGFVQFEHFTPLFLISATTLHILALETILSASKLGCKGVSAWSNIMMFLGLKPNTCLTISLWILLCSKIVLSLFV
jgi:hypothetical protein